MIEADNSAANQAATPVLWLKEVVRSPERGPEDRLTFRPGVNLIVGVPNTGKSKWLRMIDYLFGDDNKPTDAFDQELAEKYESVRAILNVGTDEWAVQRNWRQPELVTKITVNGEVMTLHAFTVKLMTALRMPLLHYPQGNPYGPRAWPELGWRSLYRHMYRRQGFWSDLADRQPESEQHACILQFLGLAQVVFSEQYGKLVGLEKKIQQLQNTREQFVAMLHEVSREIIDESELGVALTPDSIAAAIKRLETDSADLQQKRQAILEGLMNAPAKLGEGAKAAPPNLVKELGERLASVRATTQETLESIRRADDRIAEMRKHRNLIAEELGRMERAMSAGTLLADLKITNCPACDQPVERPVEPTAQCYLCHRVIDSASASESARKRLGFEVEQLKAEITETDELIQVLTTEAERLQVDRLREDEEIQRVEEELRPVRTAAASVLPPEFSILDQQTGRLHERIAQLKRVRATLDRRESIAADIQKIQAEVATLELERSAQSKDISFEHASDLVNDGMNTYLNAINKIKPNSWSQQEIDFLLQDRSIAIRIGKANWKTKLGGTLTLFFLVAYHYALMTLTRKNGCHYPGFCALDFPAQLDGVAVTDSENFVLEPFLELATANQLPFQVIAAGSSFASLEGAHRIKLTTVWT